MSTCETDLSFDETIQVSTEEPLFIEVHRKAFPTTQEFLENEKKHSIQESKSSDSYESTRRPRELLPIFAVKENLIKMINENQVLVVTGDAGCGKTTQIPQYAMEAGVIGCIASTQPRRQYAITAAKCVSEEMGTVLGEEVGYAIRFEKKRSLKTTINFMTDGMLLRECLTDPDLSSYSLIIVDEAHERSIHSDVLLGLLKRLIRKRSDLKLIITSDSEEYGTRLSKYFFDAPIVTIHTTPVEIGNTKMQSTIPQLLRRDLTATLLHLKAVDVNLLKFEFMDAPPAEAITTALMQLYALSALDDDGHLTAIGRMMANFPLESALAKSLIASVELGCSDELLTIVSMLSVPIQIENSVFNRAGGDFITLLAVYNSWKESNFSPQWLKKNSVPEKPLQQAQAIRNQLLNIMEQNHLAIVSCGDDYRKVQKAICSGFLWNAAKKDSQDGYRSLLIDQKLLIHPSSTLAHSQPEWVVFRELEMNAEAYMRGVTSIEPRWLVEFAPALFSIKKKDQD